MAYQITFIAHNGQNERWGHIITRFYAEIPFPLTMETSDSILAPLDAFYRGMSKECMVVDAISWINLNEQYEDKTHGISVMYRQGRGGMQPITAPVHYKNVLEISLAVRKGRAGKIWLRGCLDDNDVIEGENNKIGLANINKHRLALDDFNINTYGNFSQYIVTRPAIAGSTSPSAGTRPIMIYRPRAINAHAITRYRFRAEEKGPNVYNDILNSLIAMQNAWHFLNGRILTDGPFTFADAFDRALSAVSIPIECYQAIKEYLEDADGKEENGQVPPLTRFGVTAEAVLSAWKKQADKAAEAIQQLPAAHHPYKDAASGDSFIKREDLQPYVDQIRDELNALTHTVWFDAYNPRAYEGQKPATGTSGMPDIVSLAL